MWVGFAVCTLEPLAYTRPSSAEFCHPILHCIIIPYPILYFNEHQLPVSLVLTKIVNQLTSFLENDTLYSSQRHIPSI